LDYFKTFKDADGSYGFSSVPINIGYRQNLFGFNTFKWERKTEPRLFEKAKKQLVYDIELINETVASYFFDAAVAQEAYNIALQNITNADTIYLTGLERNKIAAISQADLLTLKLEKVNAVNTLTNAELDLKRAKSALAVYLGFDRNTDIQLVLPVKPLNIKVSVDEALKYAKQYNPAFLNNEYQILVAQREFERAKRENYFTADLSLSVGFNQFGNTLRDAYKNPDRRDFAQVSLSIPLIDWGVRKGKYNMAKNNLNVAQITAQQDESTLEQDIIMTVNEFNIQQNLVASAEEATEIAVTAYNETKQRFLIGKTDVNGLGLALSRQNQAKQNHIVALKNYWVTYSKLKRLTLYDYEANKNIDIDFNSYTSF
jgi:outer membrane protein TolC